MTFPQYTNNCPSGMYQKTIEITDAMMDSSGRIRSGELARQMEKITEQQLSLFGLNREEMQTEGKIWVIAWTTIHIQRLPTLGEQIILRVWPGNKKSIMYPRKYAFYSLTGEPMVCASSLFILMDSETRGFAQPMDKLSDVPAIVVNGEPELPKMQIPFPKTMSKSVVRFVQAEEIDKNGHLNNTHYLDWAEELLESSSLKEKIPQSIWVQYSKELKEGQEVVLQYEEREEKLFIQGYSEEEFSFLLVMEF